MGRRRDRDGEAGVNHPGFAFVPDPGRPGAFALRMGETDQSYVDPADPLHLEFDYVEKIAEALEAWRPAPQRIRIVHVGGGALTLPRYVAATRPTSAQVVLEPDAVMTEEVRRVLPLPPRSGIKVRAVDGRSGVAALADDHADALVLDAFAGGQVPADLATLEFIADVSRVLDAGGLLCANIGDKAPFEWSRRFVAGVLATFPDAAAGALTATWRGRRYGNIVVLGGSGLGLAHLRRRAAGAAFPYRWLARSELQTWVAGARPLLDAAAEPSPVPPDFVGKWLDG